MKAEMIYKEYKERCSRTVRDAELLHLPTLQGIDLFNPSIPFRSGDSTVMAFRGEARGTGGSRVFFCRQTPEGWELLKEMPHFALEDPFVVRIRGELVFGGVRLLFRPGEEESGDYIGWQTDFFRGQDIAQLRRFASGPVNMKDIRLVEVGDCIGVFTRPNGAQCREGRTADIGFCMLNDLSELTPETIARAPLLEDFFEADEWGGVNQAYDLGEGIIGALGHIACRDSAGISHYYSMAFGYDICSGHFTSPQILCDRACFPEFPEKSAALRDILFTAGAERAEGEWLVLYTGISDTRVGRAVVKNPFTDIKKELKSLRR